MKRKVIYILHSIEIGGVEVALLSAVRELMKHFDFTIVVLGKINQQLLSDFTEDEKSIFKTFDFPIYKYPFKLKRVIGYIKTKDPEIVICSLWRASMVGIRIKKLCPHIKLISFIHSTGFPHKLVKYYNIKAARNADLVLADSRSTFEFVKNIFKTSAPIEEVSLLTHPSPEKYYRRSVEKDKPIKFLFLGRITRVKNLPIAIKLLSELKNKGVNIKLDVYGRAESEYENVLTIIKELNMSDDVEFYGEINPQKRFTLFNQYHFLIQLSSYEGMAMGVAEAMQYGLPPVVTPVGEIPNYAQDMQSAIFIDILNEDRWNTMVGKILFIINNEKKYSELSINAYRSMLGKKIFQESLIEKIDNLLMR